MEDLRKATEQSIRLAQSALERALTDLDKMAAFDPNTVIFISHALRNYLTVTRLTTEVLATTLAEHQDADVHQGIADLRRSSEIATNLVQQLATHSPVPLPIQFEAVDLVRVTVQSCDFYRPIAARKVIDILWEEPAVRPVVLSDPLALAAILDNLLSNAIKYSPPGRQVRVRVEPEKDCVAITIEDEGPGLSEVDRGRMYQRGVRLANRPTGGEPSTGYGLAVVKELCDQLGARIVCESEVGQGTAFHVYVALKNQAS